MIKNEFTKNDAMESPEKKLNLSPRQRKLINSSWIYMKEEAGITNPLIFYDAFFKIAPEAQGFFKKNGREDFDKLGRKFSYTMDFIVGNIFRLEEVFGEIEDLGALHNKINIPHDYYPLFNRALLGLLDEVLGKKNTDEIRNAWTTALGYITEIMMQSADKKVNKFQQMLNKIFG